MPVSFIFRCQYCDAQPDPLTQMRLQGAMREFVWGAYQNALPGRWLIWHGRGLYGPPRVVGSRAASDPGQTTRAPTSGSSNAVLLCASPVPSSG